MLGIFAAATAFRVVELMMMKGMLSKQCHTVELYIVTIKLWGLMNYNPVCFRDAVCFILLPYPTPLPWSMCAWALIDYLNTTEFRTHHLGSCISRQPERKKYPG